jgi:hypothetical protein
MDLIPEDDTRAFLARLAADPRVGRVIVHLSDGTQVTGTIGPLGDRSVVIKALAGREFYDAYVRLDAVTAVEVQTRS